MLKALHRWWNHPDHYYWVTANLAARGVQRPTQRLLAGTLIGLGVLALAMLASPAGAHGDTARLVVVVAAVFCMAVGLLWVRAGWPSRRASTVSVVLAAFAVLAISVLQTHPVAGLLGCVSFAVLTAYAAFFHSARMALVTMPMAVAATGILAYRLAASGDIVWAVCAAVFVIFACAAVPFACHAVVLLLGVETLSIGIDPLTGLLGRAAFYRRTGEVIAARGRIDDCYLVILVVALDNLNLLTDTDGPSACDRARVSIGQVLRETTRSTAVVAHDDKGDAAEFLIADTFPNTDSTPLEERVRGAIASTPPRLTASIGVVATPMRGLADCPPEGLLDELIELAHGAMAEARRAGGNQAYHIVCATPNALTDKNRFDTDDAW